MTVRGYRAFAGKYVLEVLRTALRDSDEERWKWSAVARKEQQNTLPEFSGDAKTLVEAKQAACQAIGLSFANWSPTTVNG